MVQFKVNRIPVKMYVTKSSGNSDEAFEAGKQAEYDRLWDEHQDYGKRTNYAAAFGGIGWNKYTFNPKYPIVPIGTIVADHMFYMFNRISTGGVDDLFDFSDIDIDFSQCKRLTSTFQDARIKNLFVDASLATTLSSTFNAGNGGYIENLTLRVTDVTTSFTNTFSYQKNMREIRFTDDSVISASINLQWSPLTAESGVSVLAHLKDFYTDMANFGKYTVTLSEYTWALVDALGAVDPNNPTGPTWRSYTQARGWNIA